MKTGLQRAVRRPRSRENGTQKRQSKLTPTYVRLLANTNEKEAWNRLTHLTRRWHCSLIPELISILKSTRSKLIRNAIAIALRRLRAQEALKTLVKEARNPEFQGYSGTLVYAMQTLDCRAILHELADFVANGPSYEVSLMALLALEEARSPVPFQIKRRAQQILRRAQAMADLEPFRSVFIGECLEILDGLKVKRT